MYGREELEYHLITTEDLYRKKVYLKGQSDKVMDAMEARIAELERALMVLVNRIDHAYGEGDSVHPYGDMKKGGLAYTVADQVIYVKTHFGDIWGGSHQETCLRKPEAQLPGWVAVKDRLPEEGVLVYAVGKHLEGLFCFKENEWYEKDAVEDEPDSYWEVQGYVKDAIDYWMEKPLPPVPTRAEK